MVAVRNGGDDRKLGANQCVENRVEPRQGEALDGVTAAPTVPPAVPVSRPGDVPRCVAGGEALRIRRRLASRDESPPCGRRGRVVRPAVELHLNETGVGEHL